MQSQGMDPTAEEQQATINKYRSDIINMLIEQRLFELYAKENKTEILEVGKEFKDELIEFAKKSKDDVKDISSSLKNLKK